MKTNVCQIKPCKNYRIKYDDCNCPSITLIYGQTVCPFSRWNLASSMCKHYEPLPVEKFKIVVSIENEQWYKAWYRMDAIEAEPVYKKENPTFIIPKEFDTAIDAKDFANFLGITTFKTIKICE
jgi:hypothetical protein